MHTILVIEDDESLRDTVGLLLEREGFRPILAADGPTGLEEALRSRPSLMLVDLRLPGMNGLEICREVRSSRLPIPIIVLSAIGDEIDKVLLLEVGADDYIVKPFGTRELLARIRAVLRRATPDAPRIYSFADVQVDVERRIVSRAGKEVRLTPAEYNLLTFFLHNPDRPLTRDILLNSVWGYQSIPNTRTVDAHVVRLRQKLEPNPEAPVHLLTLHGVGYRFIG